MLQAEKFRMAAYIHKYQHIIAFVPVYQQKVRADMTFATAFKFPVQSMVSVLSWKNPVIPQSINHILKFTARHQNFAVHASKAVP